MSEETETVAGVATTPDKLPLAETTLIGLIHTEQGDHALFRLANGRIAKAETGGRVGVETLAAIDETGVVLSQGGRTRRLKMPKR